MTPTTISRRTPAIDHAQPNGLAGMRVLIAGASGAIGSALLTRLAEAGAVIGAQSYQHPLASRARGRVQRSRVDLTKPAACAALVDRFARWAGGLDALVQLCGSVRRPCTWDQLTPADWQADLQLNLVSPFFLAQRAMRHMTKAGGRIILTSTASAQHGGGRQSIPYGVAKAGIDCLTKALAREGAGQGILVNAIAPGFIDTPFHRRRLRRTPEELARRAAMVPLKRAGTPEEVADLILYLLSPGSRYITGQCIAVSGGDWL